MQNIVFQTLYEKVTDGKGGAERTVSGTVLRADTLQLEDDLRRYVGAPHCVTVPNATTGLIMALRAVGVSGGDAVLYTPFGFFAAQGVLKMLGAEPLPVDIDPGTWNIAPHSLECALKKRAREKKVMPKALIATDLFGLPCDFDAIGAICEEYGITLIEDMAQAFGAECHGVKTGNFGRISVSSFFPGHFLGELNGGAVFCRNEGDEAILRGMRGEYQENGNLCRESMETAIVRESLQEYDKKRMRRQRIAACYGRNLDGIVCVQQEKEGYVSAYSLYGVLLRDRRARDRILEELWEREIPCNRYTPASPCDEGEEVDRIMLRNIRSFAERVITLPMHSYLSGSVVEHVSACLAELVWKYDEERDGSAEIGKDNEPIAQ